MCCVSRSFSVAPWTWDTWKPGIQVLGLAEDGVGWALDEHNSGLVSAEMKGKVEQARADILANKITVHDYMADSTCAY